MKNTLLLFLLSLATYSLAGNSWPEVTVKDKVKVEARPFPLSDLRLLEGSLFKHAMDKDARWLLDLEPDRLLRRDLWWLGNVGSFRAYTRALSFGMFHDVCSQW